MSIKVGHSDGRSLEIVVGMVAPIGADLDKVQDAIKQSFIARHYIVEEIRLTDLMQPYVEEFKLQGSSDSIGERKIDEANNLCKHFKDEAMMAYLAVAAINDRRAQILQESSIKDENLRVVYIIKQLKRKAERDILNDVYGRRFVQVSVTDSEDNRRRNLIGSLRTNNTHLEENKVPVIAAVLLQRDEDERVDFGQEVTEVFASGDFFCDLSSQKDTRSEIDRFIRAFFGDNRISPTRDEFGSYMAKAASLRSVDLSRQVGAALFNSEGDIVSMGCNEVPKAGGGNYWYDDINKMRDIERGASSNKLEIRHIALRLLKRLEKGGALSDSMTAEKILSDDNISIGDTELFDVTEYGRMTHAEMSAICDASRNGIPTRDCQLYVTTFPCHNCAKHIVASGVARVIFIEPYQKSKALVLNEDSIARGLRSPDKVTFEHFQGVSPKRYRDIFEKSKRTSGMTINEWDEGEPLPRIGDRSQSFRPLESNLVREVSIMLRRALGKKRKGRS